MGQATDWDAELYDKVSSFQEGWARRMMDERLHLNGDETMLDAGCGSGRATRLLVERLPRGRVIGVDAAPSMIEHARAALGPEVTVFNCDLTELTPRLLNAEAGVDAVDLVFSNATFHWIPDHDTLFRRLHAVLRPGGRLVAQCGGVGNVEAFGKVVEEVGSGVPFDEYLAGWEPPWNFSSPDDAKRRLEAAGFSEIATWLTEVDASPDNPRAFMRASGFAPIFERLPAELHEAFVEAVFARLEQPIVFHYVRLNLDATKPERGARR